MVIKGVSCSGARRLAVHLMRTDTNERAEVVELRGVVAEDLRGALLEMEAVAAGSRTTKPFYHASINTRAEEKLTDTQRMRAIDALEKNLGLHDQPRVIVVHEKKDREHCHVVWSRIDLERMVAISDSHNYRKHEEVARDLERSFGHERVQGAHAERDGQKRPERTPSHAEMLAKERGAVDPQEAKRFITELWRQNETGAAFKQALEAEGWALARGDSRDFVVVDPGGGTHSLARRVEGAKAKDIRAHMADIDQASLPSVAEARAAQREARQNFSELENMLTAEFTELRANSFKVKVREPGHVAVQQQFIDGAKLAAQRARQPNQEKRFSSTQQQSPGRSSPVHTGLHVFDRATGVVSRLGDFMVDLLAGPSRPQRHSADMAAFINDPAARKRQQLTRLAVGRQGDNERRAIESIRQDMQAGRNLKADDIRLLTRQHQEQILTFGDSAVRQMVEGARKSSDRYWKGEERERD